MLSASWLIAACVSACGGGSLAASVGLELGLKRLLPQVGVPAWGGGGAGPPW